MLREQPMGDMARPRPKLRRSEKHVVTKKRLFSAAIKVVGKYGYAGASVARITAEAGVAQGTFYLHFENRQALLDQLLPVVGQAVVEAVRERDRPDLSEEEREIERCRAFFDVLLEVPEFFRIQNEAELFAPEAYKQHMDGVVAGYVRALKRGFDQRNPEAYSDDELEALVHIILGARACLGKRYGHSEDGLGAPDHVFSAYSKLMRHGLFPKTSEAKTG